MKHIRKHKSHVMRALVAVIVSAIAVPTAMTGLFPRSVDFGSDPVPQLRMLAERDAGRVRYVRRHYWQAVDTYNELQRFGYENLLPPDINDIDSIEYYLNLDNFDGSDTEVLRGSAPEEGEEDVDVDYLVDLSNLHHTYSMLPEMWRDLIDGYISTQMCAPTLSKYTVRGYEDVDLYDMCVRLLDERLAVIQPDLFGRSAYLRGLRSIGVTPINQLQLRLQSLENQLTVPRTHTGGRPRPE